MATRSARCQQVNQTNRPISDVPRIIKYVDVVEDEGFQRHPSKIWPKTYFNNKLNLVKRANIVKMIKQKCHWERSGIATRGLLHNVCVAMYRTGRHHIIPVRAGWRVDYKGATHEWRRPLSS